MYVINYVSVGGAVPMYVINNLSVGGTFVCAVPGSLLILIAHNKVLVPGGERGTQAGGRVVECLEFSGDVY